LVQSSPAQQPAPFVQAPPAFRQQLSAPSLAMPLSAQIVVPPPWPHCDDEVQDAPGVSPPAAGAAPPQTPLMQSASPQQPAFVVQAPPP